MYFAIDAKRRNVFACDVFLRRTVEEGPQRLDLRLHFRDAKGNELVIDHGFSEGLTVTAYIRWSYPAHPA